MSRSVSRAHKGQTYLIFSVDSEHDLVGKYESRTSGWSRGTRWLCEAFDQVGMRGKVCWLIEYNVKEGLPASNPDSDFFVAEFPQLIGAIKDRGDEFGVHPTVYDWVGGDRRPTADHYADISLWDLERPRHDSQFVLDVVTAAAKKLKAETLTSAVGCRTSNFHPAIGLPAALEKNAICVDSSVLRHPLEFIAKMNAYFISGVDVRQQSRSRTSVVEIPSLSTFGFGTRRGSKLWTEYFLHLPKPVFLSFFVHNYEAVTPDGKKNEAFLEKLVSFLGFLQARGVQPLAWSEAKTTFERMWSPRR